MKHAPKFESREAFLADLEALLDGGEAQHWKLSKKGNIYLQDYDQTFTVRGEELIVVNAKGERISVAGLQSPIEAAEFLWPDGDEPRDLIEELSK